MTLLLGRICSGGYQLKLACTSGLRSGGSAASYDRCLGTFCNYEGYVRTACLAMGMDAPPAENQALRRARGAIAKRMAFTKRWVICTPCCRMFVHATPIVVRQRMFVQRSILFNMVLAVARGLEVSNFAFLWIAAYMFMLRVPSEALPMARGS